MSFLSVCNFNLVCGKLKYMSFKKQFFVKNAANTLPHINLKTFRIQNIYLFLPLYKCALFAIGF